MKVRKEQLLLPKTENITAKLIQANRTPCDFTQGGSCTSVSNQVTIEGLRSALLTKIKPDVLLSNGDIIVSGNAGGPVIWQQQDGILRQALLNNEKDVKSEETNVEPISVDPCETQNETCVISEVAGNTGLLAITTVTPQQITPIAASQVIKMNDYQVILSTDALPVTWKDNVKKSNVLPVPPLTPIKPKTDASFLVSDQQISFTPLSKVSLLGQNQFPTILIKDERSPLPGTFQTNNCVSNQITTLKKSSSKTVPRITKTRKKPSQTKKLMLKPASSLLSQTALDRNKNCNEPGGEIINLTETSISLETKTINTSMGVDYTVKNPAEPIALVRNSPLCISTPSLISTLHGSIISLDSNLNKLPNNNLPLSNYGEKNGYTQSSNTVSCSKSNVVYNATSANIVGPTVTTSSILISSNSFMKNSQDHTLTLNNTVVVNNDVLIHSSPRILNSDDQTTLVHTGVLEEEDCTIINTGDNSDLRSEDYHPDHTETILPSDIEHHEEHHTQEYTDNLLSQLSNSRILPNMSSSQVCSVLNALAPSEKTNLNGMNTTNSSKTIKESVKCEPTEFVKIENLNMPDVIRLKKAVEPKYRVCELNKHMCFRCLNCMFLSLKADSVEKHWAQEHQCLRTENLDKQISRRQVRCLGCTDVFYSKYALQIHLLCDHNVITTEVHELIAATMSANKAHREPKRQSSVKSSSKTKVTSEGIEPNKAVPLDVPSTVSTTIYQPTINSVITESLTPVSTPASFIETTNIIMSETAKINEDKHVSNKEPEIPPTPNFCLFSEIQLQNNYPGDDDKKLLNTKKSSRNPRRSRTRTKTKSDFVSDISLNYRCIVERCGVRVSSVVNLKYHIRCHKNDSELLFCPECDFSVVNWSSLTPHLWREHQIDMDLYSCKHCNYKSNSYSKLMNNHVKIHSDERPFLCDLCGKGFKTRKQLRNHKVTHRVRKKNRGYPGGSENVDITPFICNICGRSFVDSRILKQHTDNVHNKVRPYLCPYCSHKASSLSSLRMHIRQHTGEKPFRCNECDYVTADHNSLRRHKMRHSGKRPYQCPHCTYSCIQATTYKCHLKNKHPGLEEGFMFSCPMCPFRTVKKDNYLAHKAEHDLGGDPRERRKKASTSPEEIVQEHSSQMNKTMTFLTEDHDVVVLLDDSDNLASVEDEEIELIVPEASSV